MDSKKYKPFIPKKQKLTTQISNKFNTNPQSFSGYTWDQQHMDKFLANSAFTKKSFHSSSNISISKGNCSHIGFSSTNSMIMASGINQKSAQKILSRTKKQKFQNKFNSSCLQNQNNLKSAKQQFIVAKKQSIYNQKKRQAKQQTYQSIRLKYLINNNFRHGIVGTQYPQKSKGLLYPLPQIKQRKKQPSPTYKQTQQVIQSQKIRENFNLKRSTESVHLPTRKHFTNSRSYNIINLAKIY